LHREFSKILKVSSPNYRKVYIRRLFYPKFQKFPLEMKVTTEHTEITEEKANEILCDLCVLCGVNFTEKFAIRFNLTTSG
jgi:hypothetical protein